MKKGIKAALCILLASLSLTFVSCGKGPELDEVREQITATVEKSLELNEIFYGDGLPVFKEMITGNDYYLVNTELSAYDSIDELKAALSEVYTTDYCTSMNEIMFVGIADNIVSLLPRFIEEEMSGNLMQDKYAESILLGDREFDYSAMTMEKSSKNSFTVRIPATLDGKKDEDAVLTFRREMTDSGAVWKLDSPTY
ncbi:MAG: hypothetical protein IJF74_03365 [Clostridia bacterium]|nr:hypothetical protein [Clostridia bacterium]